HVAPVPHRGPKRLEVGDRPLPQRVVVAVAVGRGEALEGGGPVERRAPQHVGSGGQGALRHGHTTLTLTKVAAEVVRMHYPELTSHLDRGDPSLGDNVAALDAVVADLRAHTATARLGGP